ncbi:exodeoxyribonuclease III [Saccharopolyspora karakumensis]|uniref:Exodeoxyribonuclease III n=1 Tax=Saccharopolyspora karakumensis TaxID=2530386 RepID=A0A4R5BTT0_9PSEU|nr:exodeoxyribonuclease III [Saccharopolyspora karakumensis]TDD87564.1 exodeoxyribonuclease III [Saccharopolyspora karakumensis]
MRIATWNVNSVGARLPKLLDWLGTAEPDVLCLQELKCAEDAFPFDEVGELGYEIVAHGTGRWNGVAVLSRVGLTDVRRGLLDQPGFQVDGSMFETPEPRAVAATCGGVRVWSVYVPNGREVGHAHYDYKLRWLDALCATAVEELAADRPWAVLGDFNIAPNDEDVWDIAAFEGCTHVTPEERKALTALTECGLAEVYPRALKYDVPFTYWDYRALRFPNNQGMRIDLTYGNEAFTSAVTDSYVDRNARKGKGTSDHAPVVVELDLG